MKKVLALFMVLLTMAACGNKQQPAKPSTPLEQYADSITAAYPNYKGNIAVAQKICNDFEQHIKTIPGILEGSKFTIVNMAEIDGKMMVMFSCDNPSLSLWCEDYGTDKAAQLDKTKAYKVTGGTFDRYEPVEGMAEQWLSLGSIYVKDLIVEEVK